MLGEVAATVAPLAVVVAVAAVAVVVTATVALEVVAEFWGPLVDFCSVICWCFWTSGIVA